MKGRLSAPAAQLVAWGALAVVNAITLGRTPLVRNDVNGRLLHHLYDAGQLLFAGLVSALVVVAWARRGPRRSTLAHGRLWSALERVDLLVLGVVGILVSSLTLPGDLGGTAHKIAFILPERAWLVALVVVAGLGVPGAVLLGSLSRFRIELRLLGSLLGIAVAIGNELVLLNDYPSVHLFLVWFAGLLLGSALVGAPLPRFIDSSPKLFTHTAIALISFFAVASILVPPSQTLNRRLQTIPGAPLAPILARLRAPPKDSRVPPAPARPDFPPSGGAIVEGGPIVILFVVDALRADVVANGAHADLLPNIEALRRESVEFTMARAPASGTIWTITSIFASRYYSQLYWTTRPSDSPTRSFPREDRSVRFSEILSRAGVETYSSSPMSELENYGDQFGITVGIGEESRTHMSKRYEGPNVIARLLERLSRQGPRPLFVYAHFLNAHMPYLAGTDTDDAFTRYVKSVAEVDGYLGKLQSLLSDLALKRRTVLVLAADHGEAFGEHQSQFHAVSVYEELLRVPLLIHVPGGAARTVETPVSLIDLGPTLLDLFGQTTPGSYMGQSLMPFVRGQDPVLTRPIVAETGRLQRAMVFPDGFKVIEDQRRHTLEAYDLATDPRELFDVIDGTDPRTSTRVREMREFFASNALRKEGYEPPYRP